MDLYRLFRLYVVAMAVAGIASPALAQAPLSFPWSCSKGSAQAQAPATPVPVYQTLGKVGGPDALRQQIALQPMPPQEAYAYGWFGSNPADSWKHHFGYYKSYTQWSNH